MRVANHGINAKTESVKSDPPSPSFGVVNKVKALLVTTQIDGEPMFGPMLFMEFCAANTDIGFHELKLISEALDKNGFYQGGGGVAPVFTVRIALQSALDLFNAEFHYGLALPIDREDLEAAIEIAKLRDKDDLARKIIAACAHLPARVVEGRVQVPGMTA